MKYIKNFESFNINEVFSTIGSLIGKASGAVAGGIGKISISEFIKKEDEDLGKEIYKYLKSMPKRYNSSGDYNENNINKLGNNWYYFIGTIFKNSGDEYKVEIIKHLDWKTKNIPEYTVYITNNDETKSNSGRYSGRPIEVRDTSGGKNIYNKSGFGKSERLKISQWLAKKIFSLAEESYNNVSKTLRDDARGK